MTEWDTVNLATESAAIQALDDLQGNRWVCRGQSLPYGALVPSIDRPPRQWSSRSSKQRMEREAIDLFRSTVRAFASPGEQIAMSDSFVALAVLRHYGVPTRLLDWSRSPSVAMWFAVSTNEEQDGELWAFDELAYEVEGKAQWLRDRETTTDGSGRDDKFDANVTAFLPNEPPDWLIVMTYPAGFPRQDAQFAKYTVTARFGVEHGDAIARLFSHNCSRYRRYVIRAELKPGLCAFLRERHGLWRGSLFPDSAGAAETALSAFAEGGA